MDLKPDQNNANKGTERGKELLDQSIRELGAGRSILVDKDGNVIAGNKTLQAAQKAGLKVRVVETGRDELVVVQRSDLNLDDPTGEARRLAYLDNRVAELDLEWDVNQLSADLELGIDLSLLGFDASDLIMLIGEEPSDDKDAEPKIDEADKLLEKWKVETGQLWQLGNHYLLCGDATLSGEVNKILHDRRFDLLCTDPPYGVEIKGGSSGEMTIANDTREDLPALLSGAFRNAAGSAEKKAAFYIAGPHGIQFYDFAKCIIESGMHWKQTLIWAKNNLVLGRSDYQPKHEIFFYGNFGHGRKWNGGRKQTSVIDEQLQRLKMLSERRLQINFGDEVYLVEGDHLEAYQVEPDVIRVDKPSKSDLHPTIKPMQLIKKLICNSSDKDDIVYDPFSGAGTTILACENTGRQCFAIELLPKFVAVELERWVDATGVLPNLTN